VKTIARRCAIGAFALATATLIWVRVGPLPPSLLDSSASESTEIVDRTGEVLYEARAAGGARAIALSPDALPTTVVNATLAAEDHRFWHHPGLDPSAIARAAVRDIRYGRASEGGSTITQQVAKLLLARNVESGSSHPAATAFSRTSQESPTSVKRDLWTKIREALIALRLEHRLSKREILAIYLSMAPYGNQLVGVERASQAYFGCSAGMLTPGQAAFLAALPQRPSTFNPYRELNAARARQRRILERMVSLGLLSVDESREALVERLALRREPAVFIAPHFVQRVLATLEDPHPRRVVTTLDAELQREVEDIIRAQRSTLERHGAHNVAAVVLDNATGDWLAWEGSGDYADEKHGGSIDGVVTPRQPGSALKPFTYAVAFESGETPATVLPDVPSYFLTAQEGVVYSPQNYDGRYRGPLLARRALAGSENVPAVALASRIGVPSLLRFLRRSGFSTFDKTAAHYGLGLTLGDAEVRLDELVAAYASFARGGIAIQPRMLRMASAPPDAVSLSGERLTSPRTAFWISDILSDPGAREYAFGRGNSLEFSFAVAAKSGTSQAYRDNWAIGYTRAVTVGVWVGNFDRAPLVNSSGVTGAGPLFHAILIAAERRVRGSLPEIQERPTIAGPERVERRTICALSGQTANRWCPAQVEEWVAIESPAAHCRWHQAAGHGARVAWPPEYRPWAQSQGIVTALVNEPLAARAEVPEPPLRILNPPAGAIYLVDPTLRPAFQTLALRVVAGQRRSIEWRLDGRRLGRAQSDTAFDWPLEVGRHTISALDRIGHQSDVTILVK